MKNLKNNYYQYEKIYWNNNQLVLGLDEAGRGCWAGPLVVAGVILPINYRNDDIKDSKILTAKKRESLFHEIKGNALKIETIIFSPGSVDKLNPKTASINGMKKIINHLKDQCTVALIDAESVKVNHFNTQAIIHGDQLSISIAAASIIAKVTRDHLLDELDHQYPLYGFSKHKGYGTAFHHEQLKKYGPIRNVHRYSYKPIKKLLEDR